MITNKIDRYLNEGPSRISPEEITTDVARTLALLKIFMEHTSKYPKDFNEVDRLYARIRKDLITFNNMVEEW